MKLDLASRPNPKLFVVFVSLGHDPETKPTLEGTFRFFDDGERTPLIFPEFDRRNLEVKIVERKEVGSPLDDTLSSDRRLFFAALDHLLKRADSQSRLLSHGYSLPYAQLANGHFSGSG